MTAHRFKCDTCGRFTRHLHDVPTNPPEGGIAREECCRCFDARLQGAHRD